MRRLLFIILLFFLAISCQQPKKDFNSGALCTVSDNKATIKIPIFHQDQYAWNKKETSDNVLEFECCVLLNQYRFGYFLYKFPGDEEQKGSIEKLFVSGQSTVHKEKGSSSSLVEGHGLSVSYSAPYIVLEIFDTSTIELIFKGHPSSCSFSILGFKAPKSNGRITIQYQKG